MFTTYSRTLVTAVIVVIVGLFASALAYNSSDRNLQPSITKHNSTQKMLRHVVFFSFTKDASNEVINDIGQTLTALEGSIDVIKSLEWGESVAKEQEYSHCLLVNFDSEEDLATYDKHPEHQKFIDTFDQYFRKVAIVDYWTMK